MHGYTTITDLWTKVATDSLGRLIVTTVKPKTIISPTSLDSRILLLCRMIDEKLDKKFQNTIFNNQMKKIFKSENWKKYIS